jgi:hypothetical protein
MNDGLLVTFGILTVAIFFVFLRLTKRDTPTYVLMTLFYSGMLSVAWFLAELQPYIKTP